MSSSGLIWTSLVLLTFSAIVGVLGFAPLEGFDLSALRERSNPDADLKTPEVIRRHGYPAETHKLTTEDGYVLTLHRISGGRGSKESSTTANDIKKPVIFLQHCLLCSSAVWVFMGPDNGLGFILADAGFDVWMGNARGNEYSRAHVSLDPNGEKFWDFTWSEVGYYDLPAQIDYVLRLTGERKLSYVGHSMGTTVFFAMAASRPEYNAKIRTMHALAPVTYAGRMRSPIRALAPFLANSDWIAKMLGENELLPSSDLLSLFGSIACKDGASFQGVCTNILFLLAGYDSDQMNTTTLPVILGHLPAGSSTKTVIHYAQEVLSGDFCQYDYGLIGNIRKYGHMKPPKYDLQLITAPVSLHYSDNDWLANVKDVKKLASNLPNLKGMYPVPFEEFNHLDYLLAKDVRGLLYDDLVKRLKLES